MTIYPSQEWSAALKRLQAIECECAADPDWLITYDKIAQFSISADGVTEGDTWIGNDPNWAMVCAACGKEVNVENNPQIQNDLEIVYSDLL